MPTPTAARPILERLLDGLPPQTAWTGRSMLRVLDLVQAEIGAHEQRIKALVSRTPDRERLMSLPGVGEILSAVIRCRPCMHGSIPLGRIRLDAPRFQR